MKMLVNTEPHGVDARKIRRFEGSPIDDHLTGSRNYSDEGSSSFAAIGEV
jgi:hypothetical protein